MERVKALLLLAALATLRCTAAAAAASIESERTLQLPVFQFQDLRGGDAGVMERLRAAVYDVGMFAVTGAPEGDDPEVQQQQQQPPAAAAALGALVRCTAHPTTDPEDDARVVDAALRLVTLPDGSRRRTLATATNRSAAQPIPEAAAGAGCPGFETDAARLRRAVDRTGRAYASALDVIVHGGHHASLDVDSFAAAVRDGESLEHFHMFERPARAARAARADADSSASDPDPRRPAAALQLHSDIGLFIIMTPAQYFQQLPPSPGAADTPTWQHLDARQPGRPQPGLHLQLPSGELVRPAFPDDALLVMNGEAGARWMRLHAGATAPQAAAHEVVLPEDMAGLVRAWYGRMFFPLSTARLQDPSPPSAAITFHQYRSQTMKAFVDGQPQLASAAGCSPGRRALQDNGACPAGQMYCWMQCMTIPADLPCSKDTAQCSNPAGKVWPKDFPNGDASHCMDCKLTCAASPPPSRPPPSSSPAPPAPPPALPAPVLPAPSGFCNTDLTAITMWMTGFQWSGVSSSPCVALLFPEWVLDTRVKFAFACLGVFAMGVVVAGLGAWRSQLMKAAAVYLMRMQCPPEAAKGAIACPCSPPGAAPSHTSDVQLRLHRAGWMAVEVACYAVQITLAYCLMLIAMTYEAELFIMVVLGLTAGHAVFGASLSHAVQERENPEPCCA